MIKYIAKSVLMFALIATSILVNAQKSIDTNYLYKAQINKNDTLGQVIYHQSDAIASILRKNVIVNEAKKSFRGYRIQIFSVSGVNSKDKANKAKAEFLMYNDDNQVYIVYNEPYFKVRIGDFLTKLEALRFMQTIIKEHPFAFVVADDINYPVIEDPKINLDE